MEKRNWTVLIVGGASGIGKSTIAYELARHFGINVLEFDDIQRTVKSVVDKTDATKAMFPAINDVNGHNWMNLGVEWNVQWLKDVSREMSEFLVELVERHVDENIPFIIEGDFILPELVKPMISSKVKALFIQENDINQIISNYQAREGGEKQTFRAEICISYNNWIKKSCEDMRIDMLESRPWDSVLERAVEILRK
ncbi:MAG: hypothetical protein FWE11_00450 [Defluviitaleaceae bacterium]|nr:hypothetical protein [Defluviitaleaceae bacterium]